VIRRIALAAALAAIAAIVPAGTASAANATIQAVDGTPANNFKFSFTPDPVSIQPGETVTWTFAGTNDPHNVAATSGNWTLRDGDPSQGHPDVSWTFPDEGTYTFHCEYHSAMKGTVNVGNPPPPPPPPLSEQPFENTQAAPTVLEITDDKRPALSRVRASRIAHGARVRFRVSEPGSVTVRVKQGRRTVRSRTIRLARAGSRTVNLRGLRPGGYKIEVLARDLADNRSRIKRTRLTVG
jgi:plastocyanin